MSTADSECPREPQVYDRRQQCLFSEVVLGDRLMRWAYEGPLRGVCRRLLFRSGLASRLLGWYADSVLSRGRIQRTIEGLAIDPSEFRDPVSSFRTFNEFFCRHLRADARPFSESPQILCSPADSRLLVLDPLRGKTCIPVKGAAFSLAELFGAGHEKEAQAFTGGALAVFRLCPADYHRYHFPAAGRVRSRWEITGRMDSVNPFVLALNIPVFTQNRRLVTILELEAFGRAACIEVGAFGVGAIRETHRGEHFAKGEEKGCFAFGGSTIILVLEPNSARFDADILSQSRRGIETRVLAGEQVAVGTRSSQA